MKKQRLDDLIEQTKGIFDKWNAILKDVPFSLSASSGHTYDHCRNVLKFALIIGLNEGLNDEQLNLLACACVFHDCGRVNECNDSKHGENGAEKYKAYCQMHDIIYDERVYMAICYHNIVDTRGINAFFDKGLYDELWIYRILKDADALDRFRFFGDLSAPNESKLRTDTAKDKAVLNYARAVNQKQHPGGVKRFPDVGQTITEYYHLTPIENLDLIMKNGLQPMTCQDLGYEGHTAKCTEKVVFLSDNIADTILMAPCMVAYRFEKRYTDMWRRLPMLSQFAKFDLVEFEYAILEIDLSGLEDKVITNALPGIPNHNGESMYEYLYPGTIEPERIEVLLRQYQPFFRIHTERGQAANRGR